MARPLLSMAGLDGRLGYKGVTLHRPRPAVAGYMLDAARQVAPAAWAASGGRHLAHHHCSRLNAVIDDLATRAIDRAQEIAAGSQARRLASRKTGV